LLEPGKPNRQQLEAAMVVDAALRRRAGRLAAVHFDPAQAGQVSREALEIGRDLGGAINAPAGGGGGAALTPARRRPGRCAGPYRRQIELMAGVIARLA
jgi:hypothetical protein